MLVKCKSCKSKIERNDAFKVVINDKNNYYCTEKEYLTMLEEKESRSKVIELIFEIIGQTTHTLIMKEINSISKVHSYNKILQYLQSNKYSLDKIMSKEFSSEFAKIRYFTTIIKNQIGDFKCKVEQDVDIIEKLDIVEEISYTPTKKKSFLDYIDEY